MPGRPVGHARAPDLDPDVAIAKIFKVASDPGTPYGLTPNPRVVFERMPGFRITGHASPDDKALATSGWLFGSIVRPGRLDKSVLTPEQIEHVRSLGFLAMIQVQGKTGLFGHSYFRSNPEVSYDLISLLRHRLGPNDPGRPLEWVEKPFWRIPEGQGTGAAE